MGQRIAAIIVPVPGHDPDPEEIRRYARTRLRGSRTPDDIIFRASLPHTATGKLLRKDLARQYRDRHQRAETGAP